MTLLAGQLEKRIEQARAKLEKLNEQTREIVDENRYV